MKRNYFLFGGLIVFATLVATAIVFPSLPNTVPVHWNIHDQPDRYESCWLGTLIMPGMMLAIMLLMAVLPWLSPKRFEVNGEQPPVYLQIMIIVLVFFAVVQYLMVAEALGRHVAMAQAVTAAICALVAGMGTVLARVPRNFYIGVRTPWTLASTNVWQATHRFAAKAFVIAGVVGVALTLLVHAVWLALAVMMVGVIAPAVYSLVYYKRLERHGEV